MRLIGIFRICIFCMLMVFAFAVNSYSAPNLINYEGRLADSSGIPVTATVDIVFSIYNTTSGGSALWSEPQTVTVDNGVFNVLLGSVASFPDDLFDNDELYIGIKVGSDSEMTPRQRIASVGYAIRAEATSTPSIPSGMVSFFITTCPEGWTEYAPLSGRVPLGLPNGGALEGSVGNALGNLGTRSITDVASHSHSIDPPPTSSASGGSHSHDLKLTAGGTGGTYYASGLDSYSIQSYRSGIMLSAGSHSHNTDISGFSSSATGTASVDVTMPYVQLRACVKD